MSSILLIFLYVSDKNVIRTPRHSATATHVDILEPNPILYIGFIGFTLFRTFATYAEGIRKVMHDLRVYLCGTDAKVVTFDHNHTV